VKCIGFALTRLAIHLHAYTTSVDLRHLPFYTTSCIVLLVSRVKKETVQICLTFTKLQCMMAQLQTARLVYENRFVFILCLLLLTALLI